MNVTISNVEARQDAIAVLARDASDGQWDFIMRTGDIDGTLWDHLAAEHPLLLEMSTREIAAALLARLDEIRGTLSPSWRLALARDPVDGGGGTLAALYALRLITAGPIDRTALGRAVLKRQAAVADGSCAT